MGKRSHDLNISEIPAKKGNHKGIEKTKSEIPDLIILDIMMPKMDGYEVCHTLKSDTRYSMIPSIYFSAIDQKDYANADRKSAPDAFVSKPFDPPVLLDMIEELLSK